MRIIIQIRKNKCENEKKLHLTSVLQDCGVSAFLEILVLIESSVIFSNFDAESPQPRKALERYMIPLSYTNRPKTLLKN